MSETTESSETSTAYVTTSMRLPRDLHVQLGVRAKVEGVRANVLVLRALRAFLADLDNEESP